MVTGKFVGVILGLVVTVCLAREAVALRSHAEGKGDGLRVSVPGSETLASSFMSKVQESKRRREGQRSSEDAQKSLFDACESGDVEKAVRALRAGAKAEGQDAYGVLPLGKAARWGNIEIMTLLIAHGAKVDTPDKYGDTALHHAAADRVEIMQYLLDKGADVNAVDQGNMTPLFKVCDRIRHGRAEAARLLIKNGAAVDIAMKKKIYGSYGVKTPLMMAAKKGDADLVQALVDGGAEVNFADPGGRTALFIASEWGRLDVVKLLAENGADLNAKDEEWDLTPLKVAEKHDKKDVVNFLCSKKAH